MKGGAPLLWTLLLLACVYSAMAVVLLPNASDGDRATLAETVGRR